MGIFAGSRFIILSELTEIKDALGIMDANMKPICYVKHKHSWKGPEGKAGTMIGKRMRTTDVRFEGIDSALLGEIHETPTGIMRVTRKWNVYDAQGEFKGAVKEKPKFVGSEWVLENVEGTTVATVKGDQKNHNYQVITADKYQQAIARCSFVNKDSYGVDLMLSNLDPFLVLSYVVVLDLAKTSIVIRGRGF
jgi:uncharacterized protein YxjI